MKMIFALLSLVSSSAFAAVTTIQQNLMPAASQNEINGTLGFTGGHIKQDDGVTIDASIVQLNGTYFFGLNETQAIGVGTGYSTGSTDSKYLTTTFTTDTKGLNDFSALYKGNFDLGFPTLFVQGGFHLSPEENKTTRTSTYHADATASSGRNYLEVTAGMVFPYEVLSWGFSGTYTSKLEGKSKVVDNTSGGATESETRKNGDGILLSAFGELNNAVHPNLALTYRRFYSTTFTPDDGSASSTSTGSETITIQGSVRFILNQNIELLPYLGLTFLTDNSKYDVSEYTITQTGVIGRFLF